MSNRRRLLAGGAGYNQPTNPVDTDMDVHIDVDVDIEIKINLHTNRPQLIRSELPPRLSRPR